MLLLIATPVARVLFSVFAFFRERDRTYVIVTLIVLAVVLVVGLSAGMIAVRAVLKSPLLAALRGT